MARTKTKKENGDMSYRTFKFKLYRSRRRNRKLHRQIESAGRTFNHCIALHKRYYSLFHKHLSKERLQKHLTKLKKIQRFAYLKDYGSQAVQNVTERIEFGYQKFFRKENKRPPHFRKLSKFKSFTLKQAGWELFEETHSIRINGQMYRYHKSREIEGQVKTVTIKRDATGDIFIFLTCETEKQNEVMPRLGQSIGFDFGLKEHILVAPTEADDVDMPRFFQQNRTKIRAEQKSLSRKREANIDHYIVKANGKIRIPVWKRPLEECRNYQKQRLVVARLQRRIANQREDFHWKLAQELCGKYAVICLETLNMRWMQMGHGKKVGDYGFSAFLKILRYVASRTGTQIVQIDPWFPSSQLCHDCGFRNKAVKNVKVREWTCPNCGTHHDRDRNAARNILREGLRIFESA